jgi:hypothetical protein
MRFLIKTEPAVTVSVQILAQVHPEKPLLLDYLRVYSSESGTGTNVGRY